MKINPNKWYDWDNNTMKGDDIISILNEWIAMGMLEDNKK